MKQLFIAITLLLCSGCWRMPKEGEVSTLPNTNNPTLIHEKNPGLMPSPQVDY
ncbi:MAG: hypothetical protein JWO53_1297 [Chlamydiia bacterium]|nr:hypothetical protein [Chlamydiia bacterium]